VTRVAEQIGEAIARKKARHTVVVRSTVLPGTTEDVVKPALERTSGKMAGTGFGLCVNPEFLREGTSIRDFYEPPFNLIGAADADSAEPVRTLSLGIDTPRLAATLESNRKQLQRAFDVDMATGARKVGILGLSFKAGTDDLRESPMVSLVELLYGKGLAIAIHDEHVSSARLVGANKEFIEKQIPHIWTMMRLTIPEVLGHAQVVVIGNGSPAYGGVQPLLKDGQAVIDLVRAFGTRQSDAKYQGICW